MQKGYGEMIEFVREMDKNYLKIVNDTGCSDYCMKMLENNVIEGFLSTRSVSVNNQLSYLYDISGNIPLEEKYSGKELSADDIVRIAGLLRGIIEVSESYMLNIDGVLFDIRYIFCGINDRSWNFVYNSSEASNARDGIKRVMEFILGKLDHKDGNAVILGYGLYKRVCHGEIPITRIFDNIEELTEDKKDVEYELNRRQYPSVMPESIIQEEEKTSPDYKKYIIPGAAVGVAAVILAAVLSGAAIAVVVFLICIAVFAVCLIFKMRGQFWERIVRREVDMPYEADTPQLSVSRQNVMAGVTSNIVDNATVLMSMENTSLRRIVKDGPRDEYMLTQGNVSIGSGASADILIKDSGISRLHARLTKEGEMYFIKDMNSTNGTWVNEHRLSVYEMCPVKNGDIIRLAQSRFELIDTSE